MSPRLKRPRSASSSAAWRWLALAALVFATPIVQQALTEVVTLVAHDDCGCDDDCDDCKEHGRCPGPCQTCFCCTHSNVVALTPLGMLKRQALREPFRLEREARGSEGYLSLPFRPPIG